MRDDEQDLLAEASGRKGRGREGGGGVKLKKRGGKERGQGEEE